MAISVNPEDKSPEKREIRVSFFGDEEEEPIEIDHYGDNCIVMLNSNDNEVGVWTENGVEPRSPEADSSSSDFPMPIHQETESDLTAGVGAVFDIQVIEVSTSTSSTNGSDTFDGVTVKEFIRVTDNLREFIFTPTIRFMTFSQTVSINAREWMNG